MTRSDLLTDFWRSYWWALAYDDGQDPERAIKGHQWLCREMGW